MRSSKPPAKHPVSLPASERFRYKDADVTSSPFFQRSSYLALTIRHEAVALLC